jgi:hypothetical protein
MHDYAAILTAIGGLLLVLGGGAKWALTFVDAKLTEAAKREEASRQEMRDHLETQIKDLQSTVEMLAARESIYLKRILQLEAFIQGQKGLEMPTLQGWPLR